MATPPTPKPKAEQIRLTISVTPEVHATFQRMADATGISLSRAMGEWLSDTLEGAQFLAHKLEEAKAAPRRVVQELQAMTAGSQQMLDELLTDIRARERPQAGRGDARSAPHARAAAATPPRPVIRGGKSQPPAGDKARRTPRDKR